MESVAHGQPDTGPYNCRGQYSTSKVTIDVTSPKVDLCFASFVTLSLTVFAFSESKSAVIFLDGQAKLARLERVASTRDGVCAR